MTELSQQRILSLADAHWMSVYVTANAASTPLQAHALSGWVEGLCPFNHQSVKVSEWESYDTWYCCRFRLSADDLEIQNYLRLDGLATLAEVWLNDHFLLRSNNMFLQHHLDIRGCAHIENTLYIRVLALTPKLAERKPRLPWRTAFAQPKNLAWFRTSLLGRIPTWSPPPPIIGPWLPVSIVQSLVLIERAHFHTRVVPSLAIEEGRRGLVDVELDLVALAGQTIDGVTLYVGEAAVVLERKSATELATYCGQLIIDNVELWWPHTHGAPTLYATYLDVNIGGTAVRLDCESLGFRTCDWRNLSTALSPSAANTGDATADFGLSINGIKVFCRGACWTPINIHAPAVSEAQTRQALQPLCDAGVNLLRVSGTFFYEQDHFYRLCDEMGILVWQDFMFARLAYPFSDPEFLQGALAECTQVVERLRSRPSLAIFCGNTEIEQQAAMLGLPLSSPFHAFFNETLAEVCRQLAPLTAYWPSSPAGGELPFNITQGVSHYFGVGAYQRGLEDALVNTPQFASECLAFSNVPENRGLRPFLAEQASFPTHPDYKVGVPRDVSSGWDFGDVTDHYIERLFAVDTRALRYQDPSRYFALARVATGEVMAKVMGLWRRRSSGCNGALIWFLRDLQPGAGWGLIDSDGLAKSVYFYLKRVWSPLCLWFVDEGLNGLSLHLGQEKSALDNPSVELELLRYSANGRVVASHRRPLLLTAHSQQRWNVEALFGTFFDVTYAYRFGPKEFTLIHARLLSVPTLTFGCESAESAVAHSSPSPVLLAEAFYYPVDLGVDRAREPELTAWATPQTDGHYQLTLTTQYFARAIAINVFPYVVDDNYFDMAPGTERRLRLTAPQVAKPFNGSVSVLNGHKILAIAIRELE